MARATRPRRVVGTIDWNAVEQKRPWNSATAPPSEHGELAELALAAAKEGQPRAEAGAQVVARAQPIEADYILATLRDKQQRHDEATEHLRRAFIGYRGNAWPERKLMVGAFELARALALTSPKRARVLYDALSVPLAAKQHESARLFTRMVIAPLFDRCGAQTIAALHATEPHPMWQNQILTIRANCYAIAGDPLAADAWDDLAEFAEAEQGYVVTPPAPPKPRGSS
jgi:hypothetical protein